jgi:two-component system, OmpR family, copper resistance phosphate regulon response regulator CusR
MYRILIAEDESRIAAFMEKGLKKHGFDATTVTNGEDAIAQATDYDLLLLDLGLPLKDGWAVLEALRQSGRKLPIVIVTARDSERNRKESLERGANDYLAKPFKFNELLEKVMSLLT